MYIYGSHNTTALGFPIASRVVQKQHKEKAAVSPFLSEIHQQKEHLQKEAAVVNMRTGPQIPERTDSREALFTTALPKRSEDSR